MKFHFVLPPAMFLLAVLYLSFSSLTVSKAIGLENEFVLLFLDSIAAKDVFLALIDCFLLLLTEVLLPFLPFFLLLGFGSLLMLLLKDDINILFFLPLQIAFLALAYLLSLTMMLTYLGILIGSLLLLKTFQPSKSAFATGSAFIAKHISLACIFLCIGLFFSLYLNFSSYEKPINDKNIELMQEIMPDTNSMQSLQSQLANQTADGIERSINDQYRTLQVAEVCEPLFGAIVAGLGNYKDEVARQTQNQTYVNEQLNQYVTGSVPIFSQLVKATPLILAVALFSVLQLLQPFVSALFGLIYLIIGRLKKLPLTEVT